MKVLLYGDGPSQPAGTGSWCYAETLKDLGHEVTQFDEAARLHRYQRTVPGRIYGRLFGSAWEPLRRWHAATLLQCARRVKPDICIILKGVNLAASDIRALKAGGAWVVNVNHDDFFSFHRTNWSRTQRTALPFYDYLFTTREVNVAELRPFNPRVEFFPFAFYPRIHRPIPIPSEERDMWEVDVVFVGNWEAERSKQLEELARRVPVRYAVWGSGWERLGSSSPLIPFVRGRQVTLDEMAKAIGGARVALGFLRRANRDDYTQRTFEIPACNGVLLGERTARHQSFYKEGVEAEFFDGESVNELVLKVRKLLSDDASREAMRVAGRATLMQQGHTYEDRMLHLLDLYRARLDHGVAEV
jgi:spore maturation protein CgeB